MKGEKDMKTSQSKNVALVLSSGGPRGFAYIGAIESLLAHGYHITSVAGTSMGSLIGGIYAAGKLDEFKQWLYSLDAWEVFSLMDISVSRNHIVKGDRIIEAMMQIVSNIAIEDLAIPYRAVAADLYTGEEVVFSTGSLFTAIRSSISIPSLFRPMRYGITTLIDGAVANPLPLDRVVRTPGDLLVAFDVNHVNAAELRAIQEREHQARATDLAFQESKRTEMRQAFDELRNESEISLVGRLRHIGSRGINILRDVMSYEKSFNEDTALDVGENYYDLLDRSFNLMNHRITQLMLRLHHPDILVQMPFDSYGQISDYTKAEEISQIGRRLMDEALEGEMLND